MGGRGGELKGEAAGEGAQFAQQGVGTVQVPAEVVILKDQLEEAANFSLGAGGDDDPASTVAGEVGAVVNEVFRAATGRVMVEELDAQALVYGEHPIADLVDLVKQRLLVSFENQGGHGPENEAGLPRRNIGGSGGDSLGQASEQLGELLGIGDGSGGAVTGAAVPGDDVGFLDVGDGKVLEEAVNRSAFVFASGRSGADALGREDIEQETEMGSEIGGLGAELGEVADREG